MKIAIGADHRGFDIKNHVGTLLRGMGHVSVDCGAYNTNSCDYPDIAYTVAQRVSSGEADRGILICMSGIGMVITANKVPGIRAALCHNTRSASLAKQHGDANILVLSSIELSEPIERVIDSWLKSEFEGGRHERRINRIREIENEIRRR